MINFKVRNLEAMAAQLQAAGVEVTVDPETDPNGRFGRLHDPEGNPVSCGNLRAGTHESVRRGSRVRLTGPVWYHSEAFLELGKRADLSGC
jgi:hypothetical protein